VITGRQSKAIKLAGAALAVSAAVAGCGFGASPGTKDASVRVSQDFGSGVLGNALQKDVPSSETVLSLLRRHFKVTTSSNGSSVTSIDGHRGGTGHLEWSYFVNGIQPAKSAALTDVNKGDHIWWDLHDTTATNSIAAVVGSYPEPFTNGIGGKEFPTLLNCAPNAQAACNVVGEDLHHEGVKAADQILGTGSGSDSLAVVVGTWNQVKNVIAAQLISAGPSDSGVYGQFVGPQGQALELDDTMGEVARTLPGSVGMIAATGNERLGQPTWFVTGTDTKGVMAAARAFTAAKLDGHYAVAIKGNKVIALPVAAPA
jgi:hypothetical protein